MTRLINDLLQEDINRQIKEIGNDPILSRCRVQPEVFPFFQKLQESNQISGATLVENENEIIYIHFDSQEKQEAFLEKYQILQYYFMFDYQEAS